MRIDLDRMEALAQDLQLVHTEFSDAERLTDDWKGAVGHDGLSDQLHDFSGNWNDTRDNMLEGIQGMADCAAAIVEQFTLLDQDLSDAICED